MNGETWAHRVYEKSDDFVHRNIAGELLLVPIRNHLHDVHSVYVLNETAGALWDRIDGVRTTGQVVDEFLSEFECERAQIDKDFTSLIEDLLSIKAVREKAAPVDG